jgi:hypothetical protein
MKLRTLIEVTYNNGLVGRATGIVEGHLSSCNQQLSFGFSSNFMYEYKTEAGQSLVNNMLQLSKEEINGLYEIVKSQIPTELSYTESTQYLYYLGMKVKMAETFGVTVADIEIL